jgi:hypothetical protein
MTPIESLQQTLTGLGMQPALANASQFDEPVQLLTLLLHQDDLGKDVILTMQVYEPSPEDGEDALASSIIAFTVTLPYFAAEPEVMLETMRLVLLLNRALPVGHYGFREHDGGVDFGYNLMCRDPATLDASLLDDIIASIAYYVRIHGDLIAQIVSGGVTCNEVLEQLEQVTDIADEASQSGPAAPP